MGCHKMSEKKVLGSFVSGVRAEELQVCFLGRNKTKRLHWWEEMIG